MCLAADIPLVESGTTGFNGQVQVIRRGVTECYDCNPKESPKSFPVCTIRSTPSQPIHCIVWAKSYLFNEIFGSSEDSGSTELDNTEDSENAAEIGELRKEAQALKQIRDSIGKEDFAQKIFEKVFTRDVERLRGMEDMWKSRKPPTALDYASLAKSLDIGGDIIAKQDQKNWTDAENLAVFLDSTSRLSKRIQALQASAKAGDLAAELEFDKDDVDTLDFVAAAANLRSIVFNIPLKSKFNIKQMAGNIIPAIATTNAIIAGLCVTEAFKVLREDISAVRTTFLSRSDDRFFATEKIRGPNPECPICSVTYAKLIIDPARATLGDLVEKFLKGKLGYSEELSISNDVGILYDPDMDDNLPKKLAELGVGGQSFLTIVDDEDYDDSEEEPRTNLVLAVVAQAVEEGTDPVSLPGEVKISRQPKKPLSDETDVVSSGNGVNAEQDTNGKKRKRTDSLAHEPLVKRPKVVDEDVIILDDDDEPGGGIIEIDSD
jgi:ubiquitin-like 1-activating enzyme E1 B